MLKNYEKTQELWAIGRLSNPSPKPWRSTPSETLSAGQYSWSRHLEIMKMCKTRQPCAQYSGVGSGSSHWWIRWMSASKYGCGDQTRDWQQGVRATGDRPRGSGFEGHNCVVGRRNRDRVFNEAEKFTKIYALCFWRVTTSVFDNNSFEDSLWGLHYVVRERMQYLNTSSVLFANSYAIFQHPRAKITLGLLVSQ